MGLGDLVYNSGKPSGGLGDLVFSGSDTTQEPESGRGPTPASPDSNDLYDLATNPQRAFELMSMLGNAPVTPPPDPGIWEGFIHPTLKAIPRVALATAGSLATMPFAGVAGLSELAATGDVTKAGRTIREVSALPSKVFNLTPEEQKGAENIGLAMKPIEMAGSGWKGLAELASTGDIQQAADVVQGKSGGSNIAVPIAGALGEAAAMFALPKLPKLIKDSVFYRTLTIPERGLALQSLDDVMKANPAMSEGEILRKWNNPTWQEEALSKRAIGTRPEEQGTSGSLSQVTPVTQQTPATQVTQMPNGPTPPGPPTPELMSRPGEPGLPPPEISPTAGEVRPTSPATLPPGESVPGIDRRQNEFLRRRVADMTPEDMKSALLTDHLTELPNKRAYEESTKGKVQALIDVDSLKWVNDNFGHQAGDELLQKVGKALDERVNQAPSDSGAYHLSGDEFMVHGNDVAALNQQLYNVQQILKNETLRYTGPDGVTRELKGINISVGKGKDLAAADVELQKSKIKRELSGERAGRGKEPPGIISNFAPPLPTVGWRTSVEKGGEAMAELQSQGLPRGKFFALDKPFGSTVHDASKAKKEGIPVLKNVYDPDGVIGKPTPSVHIEMIAYLNKTKPKDIRQAMTDYLQSKGYDGYVRGIDGDAKNRELIIFASLKPIKELNRQVTQSRKPTIEELLRDESKIAPKKTGDQAQTLANWIKTKGGIWDESLPGETRQFISKESGFVGLVSKLHGQALDELAALAVDDGWMPKGASGKELLDKLNYDLKAVKEGRPRASSTVIGADKQIAGKIGLGDRVLAEEGKKAEKLIKSGWEYFGKGNEIPAGNLHPGDRVLISGEEFRHSGFDKEGKAILKDGETIKVDPFDSIPAEAKKTFKESGVASKEPWQKTREEFVADSKVGKRFSKKPEDRGLERQWDKKAVKEHGKYVQAAVEYGRFVPEEVLKDYPDLNKGSRAEKKVAGIRPGPGAQTAGTGIKETPSDLAQLTQSLDAVTSPNDPLKSRIRKALDISAKASNAKDVMGTALGRLKGAAAATWNAYSKPKVWTEFKDTLGDYLYARQISSYENHDFAKTIIKQVPSKVKREAIINYIQAGEDLALLKERAVVSEGKYKAGYEAALKLNPDEVRFADNINNYFDSKLVEAKKWDMLKQGVENYVSQLYKKDDPYAKAILAELDAGLLKEDPYFLKKRIFKDYFSAEQAGKIPENKDIGYVLSAYDMAFNEAIAARTFVKSLLEAKAKDGKTHLAIVSGAGKVIDVPGGTDTAGMVIKPKQLPKEAAGIGYRNIDHPALKDWKWVGADALGDPVLIQGELVVHPEIYKHLKTVLSKSAIRQNAVGSAALTGVQTLKSTMLSLSGFHQTQEGLHAIFHKVNPATCPKIDLTHPVQKQLVRHGVMVSEYGGLEQFSEGVYSSGIINKTPGIGPLLQKYGDYLFRDYIPRIKMKMATEAFERNTARYGKKLTEDQIYEMTANQANAAFGELNYKMMGRNPTTQDVLRLIMLAPDFLEARAKFVGQGLKPFGREQSAALIRGALGLYIGAVIVNQIIDGDPHWDKPFTVVIKGKQFGLRSVPGDILHLIKDPSNFVFWRISPSTVRPILEWAMGRDASGKKRSGEDQVKDFFQTHVPIPIQGLLKDSEKTIWDSMLQSIGVSSWKDRTKAEKLVSDINFEKINRGIRTPQEKETNKLRVQVYRTFEKTGSKPGPDDLKFLKKAIQEKKVGVEEAIGWMETAQKPHLERGFKGLSLEEAQQVWKVATPDEKKLLVKTYIKKIDNRVESLSQGKTTRIPQLIE